MSEIRPGNRVRYIGEDWFPVWKGSEGVVEDTVRSTVGDSFDYAHVKFDSIPDVLSVALHSLEVTEVASQPDGGAVTPADYAAIEAAGETAENMFREEVAGGDAPIMCTCTICDEQYEFTESFMEQEYGICPECAKHFPNLGPEFSHVRTLQNMIHDLRRATRQQAAEIERLQAWARSVEAARDTFKAQRDELEASADEAQTARLAAVKELETERGKREAAEGERNQARAALKPFAGSYQVWLERETNIHFRDWLVHHVQAKKSVFIRQWFEAAADALKE